MSTTLKETMGDSRIFLTYSLAMTMLSKCSMILKDRGGDPKAIEHITTGIELLAEQLRDYADNKDLEESAEAELNKLCKLLDIRRA
ncbi:hypothetical protein KKF32_01570 [Patescibacteria group bacterium]|nr:hypothetical protein [Patescibacteria group bacterium]